MNTFIKYFFMLFCLHSLTESALSQQFYLTPNIGYGVGMGMQTIDGFYNSSMGSVSTTEEQVYVSLGKGFNVGSGAGYMFNKNLGVHVDLSFLLGDVSKAQDIYSGGNTNYAMSSNMFRFNPSMIISSGSDKLNLYAKFGFVIGSGSVLYEFIDNDDGDVSTLRLKLNGGAALGLTSGIGAVINVNEKVSFVTEINMINMSYTPKRGEFTEATLNGVDELRDMTTDEKQIQFVDVYTYNNNVSPPDSEPSKQLKQKLPFGSVGITLGVRIALNKNN